MQVGGQSCTYVCMYMCCQSPVLRKSCMCLDRSPAMEHPTPLRPYGLKEAIATNAVTDLDDLGQPEPLASLTSDSTSEEWILDIWGSGLLQPSESKALSLTSYIRILLTDTGNVGPGWTRRNRINASFHRRGTWIYSSWCSSDVWIFFRHGWR